MSMAQTLLPEYDHEMAGCRTTLERIPDGQFDFKPHPKSFTLNQLANHLATVPGYPTGIMDRAELDFASPEALAMQPAPATTRAGLLEVFDRAAAAGRAALAGAKDEDFAVIWTAKAAGQVLFALPRMAVVRSYVLNHLIHHRAQLCLYLRLLDQPVPALYGPSADEPGM